MSSRSSASHALVCTLAAYVGVSPDLPLVVAANRDEFLDRPSTDPALLAVAPWVVAGQDLNAGGTWFGLNQHGMVVGLLNRRTETCPDPTRRSRGLLCLEVLQQADLPAATALLTGLSASDYNPFNLLVADRRQALVATSVKGRIQLSDLPPGLHLLTNLDLNDPTCPRIAAAAQRFGSLDIGSDPNALVGPLQRLLADHTTALDPRASEIDTLCVHRGGYGTRSAAVVVLPRMKPARYWHAAGPPCRAELREVTLPPSSGT